MRWLVLGILLAGGCYTPGSIDCVGPDCTAPADGSSAPAKPPDAYSELSVGGRSVCAIDAGDHHLYCWGDNSLGQLGIADLPRAAVPTIVRLGPNDVTAVHVAVGASHACAIGGDGEVYCWGANASGQIDDTISGPVATPQPFSAAQGATQIAAGATSTCAILPTGGLSCWGSLTSAAGLANLGTDLAQVSVGFDHACVLSTENKVTCIGNNDAGQLGVGNTATQTTPQPVTELMTAVSAGDRETCGVGIDTKLYCWGLDDGSTPVPGPTTGWTAAAVGVNATHDAGDTQLDLACGIQGDMAMCWGTELVGGLGNGTWQAPPVSRDAPVAIGKASAVRLGLALPDSPHYARDEYDEGGCLLDGTTASCWGTNRSGELGDGTTSESIAPTTVAVPEGHGTWAAVSAGIQHTCAATSDGTVYCWGADDAGQVTGIAHSVCQGSAGCDQPRPVAAPITGTLARNDDLVTGVDYSCALVGSAITCWGANTDGVLGTSDLVHTFTVPGTWSAVLGGQAMTCGRVASDGTFQCWGHYEPRSPDSAMTYRVPAHLHQLDAFTTGGDAIGELQFGASGVCAVVDGNAQCWGVNSQNEVGNGNTVPTEIPYQTLTGVTQLSSSFEHTCASSGNSISCWGTNYSGECADSGVGSDSDPVTVPEPSGVGVPCSQVSVGPSFSCAASCTDGGVECWGEPFFGATGLLDATSGAVGYTPAEVSGLTPGERYTQVSAGDEHACAVSMAGELRCWGLGVRGELGDGSHGVPTPTPVPGR